jgi:RNA polymerase subunit RPABC4/transcription elongation factor Spt4
MKYCYQCGKMTPGEPLYCGTCGRTYDVKLCPRHHVNPRGAQVCSKCGSRDFSTPQPMVPMSLRLLGILVRLGLGLLLLYATLALLIALIRSPQVQQFFVACGILLAVLWGLWSQLPDWFREALREYVRTRRHDDDD